MDEDRFCKGGKGVLLKYIVSNFKSIGHPMEFTMFPTGKSTDDRFLKTIQTKAGVWKILRRGGFFGPNASGKSSFIESVEFARDYIVNGQKSGKGTGINQFRGELEDLHGVSLFQFMFWMDGEVYEYGFSLDRHQVHEEWLMQMTEKDFEPLFTRATDENGRTEIEIESGFGHKDSKDRILADVLRNSIQENQKNQLFLYKLHDNGIKKAESIVEWFRSLQIIFPETRVQALPIRMEADEDLRNYIGKMLDRMDTGVYDTSVASREIDFHELAERLTLPKEIVEEIEEVKNGIANLAGRYFIFSENKKKRTTLIQLKFNHRLNHSAVQFDLDEESDGTQRLIDLLPMLFAVGRNPSIYFVDEIDRSLHTKLSQFLLDEFVDSEKDGYNQIIFTAHDVNLINLRSFRQDEIWFIEKNHIGESTLRPFSDFEVKENQDTLKAYLSGRFGAVPMIKGVY